MVLAIFLLILIIDIGTVGYMFIEKWDAFDAMYMTAISLTTVGFSEVHQLSTWGRLFTIFILFAGVSFFMYIAGGVVQFMLEGHIQNMLGRRKLDKVIGKLKNHYIVCGYGRIGRVLCGKLVAKPIDIVVIDKNEELVEIMKEDGVTYIIDDSLHESTLIRAGIHKAKALIAVLSTDAENVFLVLTARQLNPDIYIMARSSNNETKSKLIAAGATSVESPYDIGAISMAQRVLRPTVTNFLDMAFTDNRKEILMEEIAINAKSSLINLNLKNSGIRQTFNLIIIAIKKSNGDMLFNPSYEYVLSDGDTVIAVGEASNLLKLEKVLDP
ncbi:MAG: potassium channel protein [Desulfobacterales bacterium]|nr:potassium channel protein [Desulfobacterales bacterium]